MDSHEAARRYLAGEMDVNEYDAIIEENISSASASTETIQAKTEHVDERVYHVYFTPKQVKSLVEQIVLHLPSAIRISNSTHNF